MFSCCQKCILVGCMFLWQVFPFYLRPCPYLRNCLCTVFPVSSPHFDSILFIVSDRAEAAHPCAKIRNSESLQQIPKFVKISYFLPMAVNSWFIFSKTLPIQPLPYVRLAEDGILRNFCPVLHSPVCKILHVLCALPRPTGHQYMMESHHKVNWNSFPKSTSIFLTFRMTNMMSHGKRKKCVYWQRESMLE